MVRYSDTSRGISYSRDPRRESIRERTAACKRILVSEIAYRLGERIVDLNHGEYPEEFETLMNNIEGILSEELCSQRNVDCRLLQGNDREQWSLCFDDYG
jgi:hypothetical protein